MILYDILYDTDVDVTVAQEARIQGRFLSLVQRRQDRIISLLDLIFVICNFHDFMFCVGTHTLAQSGSKCYFISIEN